MECCLKSCGYSRQTCPSIFTARPVGHEIKPVARWALAIITIEALFMIGVSIALFVSHDKAYPILGETYAVEGIVNMLALLFFAYDSVLSENSFQWACAQICEVVFTFFVAFQCFRNPTSLGTAWADIRFVVLGIKCFFQLVTLALWLPVHRSFGFYAYKVVGADVQLKKMFQRYRVFLSLVKFDLFVACVLFILIRAYLVSSDEDLDLILAAVSLAFSALFFILGWISVTHEAKILFFCFLATALLQPAFIVFKSVNLEENPQLIPANVTIAQFAILGGLAVGVRFAVLVAATICYCNFGKGLKTIVFQNKRALRQTEAAEGFKAKQKEAAAAAAAGNRSSVRMAALEGGVAEPLLSDGEGADLSAPSPLLMDADGNVFSVSQLAASGAERSLHAEADPHHTRDFERRDALLAKHAAVFVPDAAVAVAADNNPHFGAGSGVTRTPSKAGSRAMRAPSDGVAMTEVSGGASPVRSPVASVTSASQPYYDGSGVAANGDAMANGLEEEEIEIDYS